MGMLAAQNWFSYQRKGALDDHLRKLTKNVSNAAVEMRAFLRQTTIRVFGFCLTLQVGDVITTEKDSTHDVLIQIEGKNKFLGQIGQFAVGGRFDHSPLSASGAHPTSTAPGGANVVARRIGRGAVFHATTRGLVACAPNYFQPVRASSGVSFVSVADDRAVRNWHVLLCLRLVRHIETRVLAFNLSAAVSGDVRRDWAVSALFRGAASSF